MRIKSERIQVPKALVFPQLISSLLTNCRQELEETAQESVNRDYRQGNEVLGKILAEEQKATLEEVEKALWAVPGADPPVQLSQGSLPLLPAVLPAGGRGATLPPGGGGSSLWRAFPKSVGQRNVPGRQGTG